MWPLMSVDQDTKGVKIMAVLEEWTGEDGYHTDNTSRYLFLILFKLSLDTTILYLCWRGLHTCFLSMCGLSIVLADAFMALSMTLVWFLNPLESPVSVCFLLAHFSAVFCMLPLPMLGLGLLDYLLYDRCTVYRRPAWILLRNTALALLVWLVAVVNSYETTRSTQMEIEQFGGLKALVCEVQESVVVSHFVVGLLIVTICTLLPHYSAIPAWYRRANWLSEQREKPHRIQKSDLLRNSDGQVAREDATVKTLVEMRQQLPALWISLMLGFASVWLPYVFISVVFVFLGLGIPGYIVINMLWLECANSLMVGVVFWLTSTESGQYNHLPEDVCSWRTFLHLSRGTHGYQENFNTTEWNPSEVNANTISHQFDQLV